MKVFSCLKLDTIAIATILALSCLPARASSCSPPTPATFLNSQPSSQLPIVRTQTDLQKFEGQRVRLRGRYERFIPPRSARDTTPNPANLQPMSGIAGFQPGRRPYAPAQIVLEDDGRVFIFPLWNKQSLRSPDELEKYASHRVEVIGIVRVEQGDDPQVPHAARLVGPSIDLEQLQFSPD